MALGYLEPGVTTQRGLLEKPLRRLRARRVRSYCVGRRVLDFGCGEGAAVLHALVDVAAETVGFDRLYFGMPSRRTDAGVRLCGSYDDLPAASFDVIMALAVFEHIDAEELPLVLQRLALLLAPHGILVGTVPTPPARPLLEFLAYRLRVVDATQIADHKLYHTRASLGRVFAEGGFRLDRYERFQFGFNSFFLARPPSAPDDVNG